MNNFTIEGFNDIHFQELRGYDEISKTIEKLMHYYGYKQVLTPTFESYDMYDIYGAFPRENMFKLIDNDGRVLVLRPDATIPITRMAASGYKNPQGVFKFGYITSVFRHISSKTNFRKEFMQAGVEYLGNSYPECDAEIISLAINILTELGMDKIHIDLGEVSYLNALFDEISIDEPTKVKILNYIEHKNIGDLRAYLATIDTPKKISDILCKIPMLFGKFIDTIEEAKKLSINESMCQAVKNMEDTYNIVKKYGYENYLYIDLGFTNQLNYYSGLIFKGYINGIGESILSGGRYDTLSTSFGVDRPASGFGINISLLSDVLKDSLNEKAYFDLLLLYDSKDIDFALNYAKELRGVNISTDCMNFEYENSIDCDTYKVIARLKGDKLYLDRAMSDPPITIDKLYHLIKEEKQ